jgi:hypothetical protein
MKKFPKIDTGKIILFLALKSVVKVNNRGFLKN